MIYSTLLRRLFFQCRRRGSSESSRSAWRCQVRCPQAHRNDLSLTHIAFLPLSPPQMAQAPQSPRSATNIRWEQRSAVFRRHGRLAAPPCRRAKRARFCQTPSFRTSQHFIVSTDPDSPSLPPPACHRRHICLRLASRTARTALSWCGRHSQATRNSPVLRSPMRQAHQTPPQLQQPSFR